MFTTNISDRNKIIKQYGKNKSIESKRVMKNTRHKFKVIKQKVKAKWLELKYNEIVNYRKVDPHNAWKSIKELTKGLY